MLPGKKNHPSHIKILVPVITALPPKQSPEVPPITPEKDTEFTLKFLHCNTSEVKEETKLPRISQSSRDTGSTGTCFQGLKGTAETFKTTCPARATQISHRRNTSHFSSVLSSPAAGSSVHVQAHVCHKQLPTKTSFAKVTKISSPKSFQETKQKERKKKPKLG